MTSTESDQQSFTTFCEQMKDDVGTGQTEINSTKTNSGKAYVFSITGGNSKYARVTVDNGTVSNFIVSDTDPTNQPDNLSSSQAKTLAAGAADDLNTAQCLPDSVLSSNWRYESGWEVYFKADSVATEYPASEDVSYKEIAKFYNENKNTEFKFVVDSSVYQGNSTQAAKTLADQRAAYVKSKLVAEGINTEYISDGQRTVTNENQASSSNATLNRIVHISIDNSCK